MGILWLGLDFMPQCYYIYGFLYHLKFGLDFTLVRRTIKPSNTRKKFSIYRNTNVREKFPFQCVMQLHVGSYTKEIIQNIIEYDV